MTSSHFDLDALYTYIAYPSEEVTRAETILGHDKKSIITSVSDPELGELLLTASTVEHEFTHHRQLLSTPLGLALYLVNLACTENRAGWIRQVPYPEFSLFVRDARDFSDPLEFVRLHKLKRHPCVEHLCLVFHWELFLDVLYKFDAEKAVLWQQQRDINAARVVMEPDGGVSQDVFAWFSLLFVDDESHILCKLPTATLVELLEGAAVWREYAYVSGTLWDGFRAQFGRWTRRWLEASIGTRQYRRAADLVLEATGCNLSMALPGVLFDIALTPPFFAPRRVPWSEAHPSLRFAQILSAAADLPKRFKRYDNITRVSDDFYRDVEGWISARLGWSQVTDNLRSGADAIVERGRYVASLSAPELLLHRAAFLDRIMTRFEFSHRVRIDVKSTFLFPWVRNDYIAVRLLTCPPIVEYEDLVRLCPQDAWGESVQTSIIYAYRAVTTMFLAHTLTPHGAHAISGARRLYNKVMTEIPKCLRPEQWSEVEFTPNQSFDSFISESLGIDYERHRKIVTRGRGFS